MLLPEMLVDQTSPGRTYTMFMMHLLLLSLLLIVSGVCQAAWPGVVVRRRERGLGQKRGASLTHELLPRLHSIIIIAIQTLMVDSSKAELTASRNPLLFLVVIAAILLI